MADEQKKCQCPGGSENIIKEICEDFDKFEVWGMPHGKRNPAGFLEAFLNNP